jgi:hypothetical protein
VFFQLHRDEIMVLATDMSGKEPGELGFLGALQDATTVLLDGLSAEDRDEYAEAAAEWSAQAPPPHIQSRCVHSLSPLQFQIMSFHYRMASSM